MRHGFPSPPDCRWLFAQIVTLCDSMSSYQEVEQKRKLTYHVYKCGRFQGRLGKYVAMLRLSDHETFQSDP